MIVDTIRLQIARVQTLSAYRNGDWRKILIDECGSRLIKVPEEMTFPFYARILKATEDERLFLREEVLEKVLLARKYLQNTGFDLKVYDGWRSLTLQENLFWVYLRLFTADRFGMSQAFHNFENASDIKSFFHTLSPEIQSAMMEANRTYVSWPTRDLMHPSPHSTGGSVDVWLFKDGEASSLGVSFDWMEEDAGAFYHLKWKRKKFPGNDNRVCRNREMLLLAMLKSGFSCYGPEIWHFNFGNQMDALVKGGKAIYSYIEP